jgi:hypothetical protein
MIHRLRLYPTALECGSRRDRTKVGCGKLLQRATERAEARACAGKEDDFTGGVAGAHAEIPEKEGRNRSGIGGRNMSLCPRHFKQMLHISSRRRRS